MRTFYKLATFADDADCWHSGHTSTYNFADATEAEAVWFEEEYFTSGDYGGNGTVGRSNVRVLREEFSDLDGIAFHVCHGSYGSEWVRFDVACLTLPGERYQELRQTLDGLEDYPLISDNDHSELECSDEDEAWSNDGASDFRRTLREIAPHHDSLFDAISDDILFSAWRTMCDELNINGGSGCVHESGGVHFYFDEIALKAGWKYSSVWQYCRVTILDAIRA